MADAGPMATQRARKPRPDPVTPTAPKVLVDAGPRDCRWPVGPDKPNWMDRHLMCCEPALPGRPYCEGHDKFSRGGG